MFLERKQKALLEPLTPRAGPRDIPRGPEHFSVVASVSQFGLDGWQWRWMRAQREADYGLGLRHARLELIRRARSTSSSAHAGNQPNDCQFGTSPNIRHRFPW
jgi:hypothetical protein